MNPKHSFKYCHSIFLIQQIKLPTVSSLTMAYYFQETKGNSNNCFVLLLLLLITINFVLLLELYATTPPTSSSTASSSPSSSPTVKPTTTPTTSPPVLPSVVLTQTVIPSSTLYDTPSVTALSCPAFRCSYTRTATSTSTSTYSGTDPAEHAFAAPSSTTIVNTITTTDRQCREEKIIN